MFGMEAVSWLSVQMAVGGMLLGGYVMVFVLWPLVLAFLATVGKQRTTQFRHSKLYVGRVWHTRFVPKRHAFEYPIFMFCLDLQEDFGNFLYPIVQFRPQDHHLKNGEGRLEGQKEEKEAETTTTSLALAHRILRLVQEKTRGKFQPTLETHRVMLMTHLCYYGYNFNPVSFYYVLDIQHNKLDAMVGEVSNTPWTEMYCYVLHPDSIDQVETTFNQSTTNSKPKVDYSFPKAFHVSPFMEMDYFYDWTFVGLPLLPSLKEEQENSSSSSSLSSSLTILNTLRRRSNSEIAFTAKLIVEPQDMTPWAVVRQLIQFPIFCFLIQIWIHYQAMWLFIKGIVYIPHPQGSETAASKAIATMMIPFFALRDKWNPKSKTA